MQCSNHHERPGTFLCLSCGQWYCQDCMGSISPTPTCRKCMGRSAPNGDILAKANTALEFAKKTRKWLHLYFGLFSLGLLGLGLYLFRYVDSWLLFVPFVCSLIPQPILLYVNRAKKTVLTVKQVNALLQTNPTMTAKRLSEAAGVDEATAENFLKTMARNGNLVVDSSSERLVYHKTPELP